MDLYRLIPPDFFRAGEWQSLVQKSGCLKIARATEEKKYLFTESTSRESVGCHPLVIRVRGRIGEVNNLMMLRSDHAILNKLADCPNIYMALKGEEPPAEHPYTGLYPIHDTLYQLATKGVRIGAAMLPSVEDPSTAVEYARAGISIYGAVTDDNFMKPIKDLLDSIKAGRLPALINADSRVWVILHYLKPKEYENVVELDTERTTYKSREWGNASVDAVTISFMKLLPKVVSLVASCTTDLPAWNDWKEMSSAGKVSIRSRSRIVQVDLAYLQYLTSIKYRSVEKRKNALKYLKNMVTLYSKSKENEGDHGSNRVKACKNLLNTIAQEEERLTVI
jgi:hypothetical protein